MEDEERKVDLSHRTIQDEQARLRKKRQKAENVFAVFKKPLHESLTSVLPVMLIVLVLCFTIAPVPNNAMVAFLLGGLMLIAGMGLFTLGSEMSMIPLGEAVGKEITRSKKVWVIVGISFLIGVIITVAEPDLQVLAETVPHINNTILLVTVGIGVGFFLSVCMLRIVTGVKLRWLLIAFYGVVFILASFAAPDFLSVAFDSGGVTTGPMTVPFILALGVGVSYIRSDARAEADSFGLVALCSIGPILAVLILSFFYTESSGALEITTSSFANTSAIGAAYLHDLPKYMGEMAIALLPIVVIFFAFQFLTLHMPRRNLAKIVIGILYTYVGLVLFLTGVNVGFSTLGEVLGAELADGWTRWLLIPLSMLLGWFIISAEPAVAVLEAQIEEVSAGTIPGSAIKTSLSIAIALAMGFSMLRVLTGISIMWFLIPGYVVALGLSFFVPDLYTAIAFDSGGVASGPMTATFMLQFMIGASTVVGGNPLIDAFGVVAMVAMMPLISIQMVGFIYSRRTVPEIAREQYGDDEIIELWEVNPV